MMYWLNKLPSLRNTYLVIEQLLNQKDYTSAEELLSSIPSTYELDEGDLIEYEKYGELYLFKKDLLQNDIPIDHLEGARKIELENIGSSSTQSMARTMARVPLCYFYHVCFDDEVKAPPSVSGNKVIIQNMEQKVKDKAVTLFPNPGHDYVIISWKLELGELAKEVLITDAVGKPVETIPLNGNVGQYKWDVKSVTSGNYFYTFKDDKGKPISGSISIVH